MTPTIPTIPPAASFPAPLGEVVADAADPLTELTLSLALCTAAETEADRDGPDPLEGLRIAEPVEEG